MSGTNASTDEFTYESNHQLLNTMLIASNAIKAANGTLALKRRTREYLFQVEDKLDEAIEFMHDVMEAEFSDHPGYRRWGMKEGWIEPETDEEFAWYEENVEPERDHASEAEKANRSRQWQEATVED